MFKSGRRGPKWRLPVLRCPCKWTLSRLRQAPILSGLAESGCGDQGGVGFGRGVIGIARRIPARFGCHTATNFAMAAMSLSAADGDKTFCGADALVLWKGKSHENCESYDEPVVASYHYRVRPIWQRKQQRWFRQYKHACDDQWLASDKQIGLPAKDLAASREQGRRGIAPKHGKTFHEAVKAFFPMTGSETDWNGAYYRLEDYFRALRMVNKVHQSQIILQILESVAQRHAGVPGQNPTALAMEEARAAMDQWFEGILGQREHITVVGLISLLATDAPERWPVAFLSEEVPAEFLREMQESDVRAGPDLQVSSMVPRPIDVSPLLDPIHFPDALEKIRWSVAIFAMVAAFAAIFVSVFLFAR
jgi:hypothetical protein